MLSSILVETRGSTLDANSNASSSNARFSSGEASKLAWLHNEEVCFSVQYAAASAALPWSAVAAAAARFHSEAAKAARPLEEAASARSTSLSSTA